MLGPSGRMVMIFGANCGIGRAISERPLAELIANGRLEAMM